jgi:predicted phosphodiesterase
MRVAAIYDIHANLPALEAVIGEIREVGVDQIVVGGDVLPGPMPRETVEYLMKLDIPARFIYGNGEVAVLEQMAGREPGAVPRAFRPIIEWNAEQLSVEHRNELAGWPATIVLEIPGLGEVLFCHATPRNENEIFTRLTAEEKLLPVFEGCNVVVCGHTHMQFDRMAGKTRVVNAGSVGMPFGAAGAYWLLLGPGVELRRTGYDLGEAAERVRGSGYPQADEFAERSVLRPPSEEEMLHAFSRAELK